MTTYLVTGATRGLGYEFARQLSERGDHVIGTARYADKAGPLEALRVQIVGLDLSDPASIEALADLAASEETIDVLINNAGVSSSSTRLAECDGPELHRVLHINAVAPVLVSRAMLPAVRKSGRRLIVNISSQLGSLGAFAGGSSYAYRASKTALNMFTVCMAHELRPLGITCVAVHPGWVRTDMGGPKAPIEPSDSVRRLIALIDRLRPEDTGRFLDLDGNVLPW